MSTVLGIHVGHHSSCAVVRDGTLLCAVQQERVTRRKYEDYFGLTNDLPVDYCLRAANISIDDVTYICSSFQAVGHSGFGLHQPLVAPGFSLFDPFDARHYVISHHLAHAYHTFGLSGFTDGTVLVCDLAGSATPSGADYSLKFSEWYAWLTSFGEPVAAVSENLSIYAAGPQGLRLVHRAYALPHVAGDSFVQSPASLYENVARFVFGGGDAYGQLMALAAYGEREPGQSADNLVAVDSGTLAVRFKNNWQHRVQWTSKPLDHRRLAWATQAATEKSLLAYAELARRLTGARNLAVAGGMFLNIPSNTRIAQSGLFDRYYVPSAPHDAGIAIGCAIHGATSALDTKFPFAHELSSDRLGREYDAQDCERALRKYSQFVSVSESPVIPSTMALLLNTGEVVMRWSGRAEFGPRALGGRSFLATPLFAESKQKLNAIKGRQEWRPVAPIIPEAACRDYFSGVDQSPYMTFAQEVIDTYRSRLPALSHPDGTTRAQTLRRDWDPWLFELLQAFGALTGFPILVNTSLNGRGEPMVESPEDAVLLFLRTPDVRFLLLGEILVTRAAGEPTTELILGLAVDAVIQTRIKDGTLSYRVACGKRGIHDIDCETYELLARIGPRASLGEVLYAMKLNMTPGLFERIQVLVGWGVLLCL